MCSCEPENEELLTSSCSSWETAELLIETKMKMENGLQSLSHRTFEIKTYVYLWGNNQVCRYKEIQK